MIDKLIVLSPSVRKEFAELAIEKGQRWGGYESRLDLRTTQRALPAFLHYGGLHTGAHKLKLIGVSRLGLSGVQKIIVGVFPELSEVRIFRIDCCVDFLGMSVWEFGLNCYVPRGQNFRIYRNRRGMSIYLRYSRQKTLMFYDRGAVLRNKRDPLAGLFLPSDRLTRLEIQLKGAGVPLRRFLDIHRYAEISLLEELRFSKFRVKPDKTKPMQFLAATGLRALVDEFGLQTVSKMFPSPVWAFWRDKFLKPGSGDEIATLDARMKKSVRDWVLDRIRFPRVRNAEGSQ